MRNLIFQYVSFMFEKYVTKTEKSLFYRRISNEFLNFPDFAFDAITHGSDLIKACQIKGKAREAVKTVLGFRRESISRHCVVLGVSK